MSLHKKMQATSARVKGISFHPTRPWVLTTMHSGSIKIWDYNMSIQIAKLDQEQVPVRGCDFHPHLPLFVTGSDTGHLKVWNYKQKRCMFILKGHIDYIRTVYFHKQLPWILSASDDQTMRLWNYQSRNCINIITGHSHYVMCAQFHPEKNLIISAGLDSSVRLWDYSVLRKKLTESKTTQQGFVSIQIQCLKVLDGHERGVNWACFHPTSNLIASGSDDKKIKLWKYTNQVAWEHSTILGHKNNVSCLQFDPVTQNLVTDSQDKTIRIWNTETKTQVQSHKQQKSRYWILRLRQNGSLLACGHDEGFQVFQLNREKIPFAMLVFNYIVFAQGMNSVLYSITSKKETMELYQYKQKDKNSVCFIEKLIQNPYDRAYFLVQIHESSQQKKHFMLKKAEAHLNFPALLREFEGTHACFISDTHAVVIQSPKQLKIINERYGCVSLTPTAFDIEMKRVFTCFNKKQVLIYASNNRKLYRYSLQSKLFGPVFTIEEGDEARMIVYGFDKAAICGKTNIYLISNDFKIISIVREKFPIRSAFWESQNLLFYSTINHLKYCFLNGQSGVLKTLDEPFHILKKLDGNKFLAFSPRLKVHEIQFPDYSELAFKVAISSRNVEMIKSLLVKFKDSKKKMFIKQLVEAGYSELAIDLVTQVEQKFSLAIQSSNFNLAYELCNKVNTQQYWKLFGEEALKQGVYEAYQLSCQKLKNYDQLNFLYSLQNNNEKLQRMLNIAKKTNNSILAFNTNLFLNNGETYQNILREAGLESLAELSREAFAQGGKKSDLLKRLGSRPMKPMEAVGEDNGQNWPLNTEKEEQVEA